MTSTYDWVSSTMELKVHSHMGKHNVDRTGFLLTNGAKMMFKVTNFVRRGGKTGRGRSELVRPTRVPRGMTHRDWARREFERRTPVLRDCSQPEGIWQWILEVEELFRDVNPSEHVRVTYAMYKLKGPAYGWWQKIEFESGPCRALDMSWEEFKARMMEDMAVDGFLSRITSEFYSFRLSWLTIDEYTAEFRRMLPLMHHMVRRRRDEVKFYTLGLPEMYRSYVGKQRCLDMAWLCALEIESETVPNWVKADEADTRRHRSRVAGEPIDDDCPRCGQHAEEILNCTCLDMECNLCGDWRHIATRCTAGATY